MGSQKGLEPWSPSPWGATLSPAPLPPQHKEAAG